MRQPVAYARRRAAQRGGVQGVFLALVLLAACLALAAPWWWGGKAALPKELSFETASVSKLKMHEHVPSSAKPKARPTEEDDTTFTDNYDAEKIASYYGAKYRRSTDTLLNIVLSAAAAAKENNISPFILLAIISHESNFLVTARNPSGAEGLMQIMIPLHEKRFERYGGIRMIHVPEVNVRVGATILRECIGIMKSVRGGLRCYAGTINTDDGGFVDYVISEATMVKKMASRPAPEAAR